MRGCHWDNTQQNPARFCEFVKVSNLSSLHFTATDYVSNSNLVQHETQLCVRCMVKPLHARLYQSFNIVLASDGRILNDGLRVLRGLNQAGDDGGVELSNFSRLALDLIEFPPLLGYPGFAFYIMV